MIIFDAQFMLHRVLSIPDFLTLEFEGKATGGAFGFISTLQTVVGALPGNHKIVCVFDGKHSKRRQTIYPEYKANRDPKTPEEKAAKEIYFQNFTTQKTLVNQFLPILGILSLVMENYEADDVIYKICESHKDEEVIVISEDKDMLQLINHFEHVKVFRPIAKQLVNRANFKTITGVDYELFLIYKALMGDKSDNIKNIYGVGETTILEILEKVDKNDPINWILQYSKQLYEEEKKKNKTSFSKKAKIYEGWGTFAKNLELIDLSREEFCANDLFMLKRAVNDFVPRMFVNEFKNLCSECGFNSILRNLDMWLLSFGKEAGERINKR